MRDDVAVLTAIAMRQDAAGGRAAPTIRRESAIAWPAVWPRSGSACSRASAAILSPSISLRWVSLATTRRSAATLPNARVAAIQVSAFYASNPPSHYARFAFCKRDAVLDEALARLTNYVRSGSYRMAARAGTDRARAGALAG